VIERGVIILTLCVFIGCSAKVPDSNTTVAVSPLPTYSPQPDPTVLAGQVEFAQFQSSFYPLWLRLKKAIEVGAGNPEFEDLERKFGNVQPNLKDPIKQKAAAEFVRDCRFRCITSISQRTLFAVEATTGRLAKAQEDDARNRSQDLEFVKQGEQRWKELETGQLIPVAEQTELEIGQKIYHQDGGYVGMVKQSKVENGEMQWVVSTPNGSDQVKPLKDWQNSGYFCVNQDMR